MADGGNEEVSLIKHSASGWVGFPERFEMFWIVRCFNCVCDDKEFVLTEFLQEANEVLLLGWAVSLM